VIDDFTGKKIFKKTDLISLLMEIRRNNYQPKMMRIPSTSKEVEVDCLLIKDGHEVLVLLKDFS
jgi:hypothetical protein